MSLSWFHSVTKCFFLLFLTAPTIFLSKIFPGYFPHVLIALCQVCWHSPVYHEETNAVGRLVERFPTRSFQNAKLTQKLPLMLFIQGMYSNHYTIPYSIILLDYKYSSLGLLYPHFYLQVKVTGSRAYYKIVILLQYKTFWTAFVHFV